MHLKVVQVPSSIFNYATENTQISPAPQLRRLFEGSAYQPFHPMLIEGGANSRKYGISAALEVREHIMFENSNADGMIELIGEVYF